MVIYQKMMYYNDHFLACSSSAGIYRQMNEIALLIGHALLLKLSSNKIPWALYQSNSLLQLKSKSKLYHKPPMQS